MQRVRIWDGPSKEGILPSPNQWIGLQCVDHLLNGTQPRGRWFDFDAWDNKGRPADRKPFLRAVEVELTPLTGWERRPAERYRAFCQRLFDDIVADHADKQFLGLAAALAVPPTYVPPEVKRCRCPAFSAMGPREPVAQSGRFAVHAPERSARRCESKAIPPGIVVLSRLDPSLR